jgi:hypothetical protein
MEPRKMGFIKKLEASFDNTPDGFSARKLSAFVGVIVAIIATFKYVDEKVIISALMVWLVFAMMCLGIVTAEQILKFYKKGGDDSGVSNTEAPSVVENKEVNVEIKQ